MTIHIEPWMIKAAIIGFLVAFPFIFCLIHDDSPYDFTGAFVIVGSWVGALVGGVFWFIGWALE